MKNLLKTLVCVGTLVSASCFANEYDDKSDSKSEIISIGPVLGTCAVNSTMFVYQPGKFEIIFHLDGVLETKYPKEKKVVYSTFDNSSRESFIKIVAHFFAENITPEAVSKIPRNCIEHMVADAFDRNFPQFSKKQ